MTAPTVTDSLRIAPVPAAVVLISAWLDIRCESAIFAANSPTDALFPLAAARQAAEL